MNFNRKSSLPAQVEIVHYDENGAIFVPSSSNQNEYDILFSWVDKDNIRQLRNALLKITNQGCVSYIHIYSSIRTIKKGLVNYKKEIVLNDLSIF